MAHMIDDSKGFPAIAFVGETPWHGLGTQLTPDADIDTWTREAGLDYEVKESMVKYLDGDELKDYPERKVLFRSDTGMRLSVVSKPYCTVQPRVIMDFYRALAEKNKARMEVAGALDGGRRIWALMRLGEGVKLLHAEEVRPYLLVATSYDTSMATIGKDTGICVVCNNTLTMAAGNANTGEGQSEKDSVAIRIPHSQEFDIDEARIELGLCFDRFEEFISNARRLAKVKVDDAFATQFLKTLLPTPVKTIEGKRVELKVEEGKTFKWIMDLFKGQQMGADIEERSGTAYGLLNAVTEYVDHHRGVQASRLSSAWFGNGGALKDDALRILCEVTA